MAYGHVLDGSGGSIFDPENAVIRGVWGCARLHDGIRRALPTDRHVLGHVDAILGMDRILDEDGIAARGIVDGLLDGLVVAAEGTHSH
jgi:hypothetical protein